MLVILDLTSRFTLSHSLLISCTSSFWSVYAISYSFSSKPRQNDLRTESNGMQKVCLGGGRGGLGESWLLSLGSTSSYVSVFDSVLACDFSPSALLFSYIFVFVFYLLAVGEFCCKFD